jgi:mandelate racemase
VSLRSPLQTGGGLVRTAPLVLVDLETEQGVTGRAYVFVSTSLALGPVAALVAGLGEALRGMPVAPLVVEQAPEPESVDE